VIDGERVVHEAHYPHPVTTVWAALTDPAALAAWLMPNNFAPVPGHRFQLDARPGFGIIEGEVLDAEPPRFLRCRWTIETVDTLVTFHLEPEGSGTRLSLEHVGLSGPRHLEFEPGWAAKLSADLELLLRNGNARQTHRREAAG
jgi:uncharacterized protein YndB with AHSA1/START domain